jgi:hypothetical protein
MELRENLPAAAGRLSSKAMSPHQLLARRDLRRPAGYEDHLTRRQAAHLLGFASEFKIRQLERQGLLRSVRGPMRTAFYARADVLAVKAHLAKTTGEAADEWADADLLALLAAPTATGRVRNALDLVRETRITIERAEQVYRFWAAGGTTMRGSAGDAGMAPSPAGSTRDPLPPSSERRPLPAPRGEAGSGAERDERRGQGRLARDGLIRALRDPDPRVRQRAFEQLRESRSGEVA